MASPPVRQPRFTRICPHTVLTSIVSRLRIERSMQRRRTPSVPVSAKINSSTLPTSRGRTRAPSVTPGRSFFIWTGVMNTSRHPSSIRRSRTNPSVSPVTSSTFVSSNTTDSSCASAEDSPIKTRRMFARGAKSMLPPPDPILSIVIAGSGPNESARTLTKAAPVGVVSSASIGTAASGMPRRISAVPGAGTGQMP